jgi:hypothetical protein
VNDIDIQANQLNSQILIQLRFTLGKAPLHHEVSALNISELAHAAEEAAIGAGLQPYRARPAGENTNAPNLAPLLRPRRERPRGRRAAAPPRRRPMP